VADLFAYSDAYSGPSVKRTAGVAMLLFTVKIYDVRPEKSSKYDTEHKGAPAIAKITRKACGGDEGRALGASIVSISCMWKM